MEGRKVNITEEGKGEDKVYITVRPSREGIQRWAAEKGFQPATAEQVFWLANILSNLSAHPYLRGRLVLKGGTALNLFVLDTPRLSVDLDLDYIGKVEKEGMLEERPEVERAVESVLGAISLGFRKRSEYAATIYRVQYRSVLVGGGAVDVEINWLMRLPLLPPQERDCDFLALRVKAKTLATEELMAGKMKAFLERGEGRDLFDLYMMAKGEISVDRGIWRKLTIALFSTVSERNISGSRGIEIEDLREYRLEHALDLDEREIRRRLEPVLPAGSMPSVREMVEAVEPLVREVLDWDEGERAYMDALLDRGEVRGDLLFPDMPDLAQRWQNHPAVIWKAE